LKSCVSHILPKDVMGCGIRSVEGQTTSSVCDRIVLDTKVKQPGSMHVLWPVGFKLGVCSCLCTEDNLRACSGDVLARVTYSRVL